MPLDQVFNQSWTRKHDSPDVPKVSAAPRTVYAHSLQDLIDICSNHAPGEQLHAAGSHWGLSDAAISDNTFIETHDPNNLHHAMGETLYTVLPGCMNDDFINALAVKKAKPFMNVPPADETIYPIHIETGKRIYQLYAELDAGDTNEKSLATLLSSKYGNDTYLGPWAFATLGGAGGQTVFGALHTGTHGGDFRIPPVAGAVMAFHLVVDGGRHYWIEPASFYFNIQAPLTDTQKLKLLYDDENFEVIRDDDIFNAVLISAGRFGIVYSIVLAAVPQYTLHQERNLTTWHDIKAQINNTDSGLYTQISDYPNKFLQIAVSVTPHNSFKSNYASVTKRRNIMVDPALATAGRAERVGDGFRYAGNSHPYEPDPANPGAAKSASFLQNACTDANFMIGVLKAVIKELEDFTSSHGAVIGPIIAAVGSAGGSGLLTLLAALLVELALLATLLAAIESAVSPRFGQVMNDLRGALLGDPTTRPAGLFVWQMIAAKVFTDLQNDAKFDAISYAVMDGFDYLDRNCTNNADSIEVFFDATDMMLVAFVDALLAFEVGQEITSGKAFVGWISLRFTGQSHALLAPQKFPISCAVEIAGLADVTGSQDLIDYAQMLALNPNFMGTLHWGQHNDSSRTQIEQRFGDPLADPNSLMARWRKALSRITQDGKLAGFSNAFTRRTGLEER